MKVLLLRVLRTLMRRSEQPKRAKVFFVSSFMQTPVFSDFSSIEI